MKWICLICSLWMFWGCANSLQVSYTTAESPKQQYWTFESPQVVCIQNDTLSVDGYQRIPMQDIYQMKETKGSKYAVGATLGGLLGIVPGGLLGIVGAMGCDVEESSCSSVSLVGGVLAGVVLVGGYFGDLAGSEVLPLNSVTRCEAKSP